jgi:hypothetical protein
VVANADRANRLDHVFLIMRALNDRNLLVRAVIMRAARAIVRSLPAPIGDSARRGEAGS